MLMLGACIGDDFVDDRVDPVLRITNSIDSLAIDSSYQFEFSYLNNVGQEEQIAAVWTSGSEEIISITDTGFATALAAGSSEIQASYEYEGGRAIDIIQVSVGGNTVETEITGKKGTVQTTSSYKLQGDFTLAEVGSDLQLNFGSDYEASTALPGLFVYLSNNPNTTADALEIQAVEVFAGAHSYTIPNVGIEDYRYVLYFCKPFNVKVGHGEIVE